MNEFLAPDGTRWGIEVMLPGSSNAMIVFHHPAGQSRRLDRYNWVISTGPEARSVTSRLDPKRVLEKLTRPQVARLFRRSMPISRPPSGAPELAPA